MIITVGAGGAATKLTVPEDGVGPPLPGSWDTGGRRGGALAVVTTEGTAVVLTNGGALVKGTPRLTYVGLVSAPTEVEGIAIAISVDGVDIA